MDITRCGNPNCASRPLIPEPRSLPVAGRMPCPVCGSKARQFEVILNAVLQAESTLTMGVRATASGSVDVAPPQPAPDNVRHLELVMPLPPDPLAEPVAAKLAAAFTGIAPSHEIRVVFRDLGLPPDPPCVLEVFAVDGTLLASGVGTNPADALSYAFEHMLPPDSPEAHDPDDDQRQMDDED